MSVPPQDLAEVSQNRLLGGHNEPNPESLVNGAPSGTLKAANPTPSESTDENKAAAGGGSSVCNPFSESPRAYSKRGFISFIFAHHVPVSALSFPGYPALTFPGNPGYPTRGYIAHKGGIA
jgi:hypothetical protein